MHFQQSSLNYHPIPTKVRAVISNSYKFFIPKKQTEFTINQNPYNYAIIQAGSTSTHKATHWPNPNFISLCGLSNLFFPICNMLLDQIWTAWMISLSGSPYNMGGWFAPMHSALGWTGLTGLRRGGFHLFPIATTSTTIISFTNGMYHVSVPTKQMLTYVEIWRSTQTESKLRSMTLPRVSLALQTCQKSYKRNQSSKEPTLKHVVNWHQHFITGPLLPLFH